MIQAGHWFTDSYPVFTYEAMKWHLHQPDGDGIPCALEKVYGCGFWEYLKAKPELDAQFTKAMIAADSVGESFCRFRGD